MIRDFNKWLATMKESIATYDYYVDFNSVYKNTEDIKIELNILNSLIGSKNIEAEFESLLEKYPEILKAIPILIAKREKEIKCTDKNGYVRYEFNKPIQTKEQYKYFLKETGLFDLMKNHLVNNLYDYVLGVETGLNSNGRKNRGGDLMENIVEQHIKKSGIPNLAEMSPIFSFDFEYGYYKEMYLFDLQSISGIDLSTLSNKGKAEKRFDFVVKAKNMFYGIECNFYASSGSKLNETARSYKTLALESKEINNFKFVWITDGVGWNTAKNNLEETFDVLDTLYNINDLENDAFKKLFKKE